MKTKTAAWLGALWLASLHLWGAQPAQVGLHCLSFRLDPASAKSLGINYTLTLGTGPGAAGGSNGELAPLFSTNAPTSHGCRFSLESDVLLQPIVGNLFLDIPPFTDVNSNSVSDIFEVSQDGSGGSTGLFVDDLTHEQGKINASWSRPAGSAAGTCSLAMHSSYLDLTFVHNLALLEYGSNLVYTPTSGTVTGAVTLTDASSSSNTLSGALVFQKLDADNLSLQAGALTNAQNQSWFYMGTAPGETIARGSTNYVGFLDVADGDLSTPSADYLTWLILVSDQNDTNQNGIPDLSDPASPHLPKLALASVKGQLQLSLHGDLGWPYRIQQISTLGQTNWQAIVSVTLTNDPQSVVLPSPKTNPSFWRVASP